MLIEFIIMSILGTMLHFTYDWSKHNKVVGLFSAVNESTWEHMKMALTSFFICSIIDGFFLSNNPNYFLAKFFGLLAIIIVMPLIFYGYTSVTKKPILVIDILSFYITIASGICAFKFIYNLPPVPNTISYLGILGVFIIFGFYMIMTLSPIKNFLFIDPITKKYGIKGHLKDKKQSNK